jgi:hypothetical protein
MEGLTLEVKQMSGIVVGDCACHEMADKDGQLFPAVEKVLEQKSSQLPDCWTE